MTTCEKIVYIMGRGQSGSTFTDVLLGNVSGVESVGEVISGLNRGKQEICSCSKTLLECDYWSAVCREYAAKTDGGNLVDDASWMWRVSDIRNFISGYFGNITSRGSKWYDLANRNRALMESIATVSKCETIVDSNKEYTRGLMLLRSEPAAKVIHLFRSPEAIVGSRYFRLREKKLPFKFMKREWPVGEFTIFPAMMLVALAWSVGMLFAVIVKARFPDRVLHLRYENLVGNPEAELKRIGDFLSIDTSQVIQGIQDEVKFSPGHNLGGNDLRHDGYFRFIPNVKGRRKLPLPYLVGVMVLAFPGNVIRQLFVNAG